MVRAGLKFIEKTPSHFACGQARPTSFNLTILNAIDIFLCYIPIKLA